MSHWKTIYIFKENLLRYGAIYVVWLTRHDYSYPESNAKWDFKEENFMRKPVKIDLMCTTQQRKRRNLRLKVLNTLVSNCKFINCFYLLLSDIHEPVYLEPWLLNPITKLNLKRKILNGIGVSFNLGLEMIYAKGTHTTKCC